MAHIYRFFGHKLADGVWSLDEEEARHAIKVLRLADGSQAEVMDGKGHVAAGRIVIESKSKASVHDAAETYTQKDPFNRCLLMGALKPGDVDDLIAPLTELGVDKLIVFHQSDTAQFRLSDSAVERWRRLVRSAVKQSKRAWELEFECAGDLRAALGLTQNIPVRWILDPDAPTDILAEISEVTPGSPGIAVLIGGERGLSQTESSLALGQGYKPVKLGPWVLRARTAAQAAAVFLGMLPRP
jgi:16S rRNA (uracil1498-N3)-methyltransferase